MMKFAGLSSLVLGAAVCLPAVVCGQGPQTKLAFDKLVVKIEPFPLDSFRQVEQLDVEPGGRCWYKVEAREAQRGLPARTGAMFGHPLSAAHIERLNKRLADTEWLTAKGAEGRATHTHPTTVTITLTKDGKQRTVVCHGQRPAPYEALLHAIFSLAVQERRIYLRNHVTGEAGDAAWAEIGREIAALRGDPSGEPVFAVDYGRYLPMARDVLHPFHTRSDDELVVAVRLIGHFKAADELKFLHQLAHDRSTGVRHEVAWALARIHDPQSLPILASMMSAPSNLEHAGAQLVRWGDEAAPFIVELIAKSTDPKLEHWEHTVGEDMIRAYLGHWEKLDRIDPQVEAAVRAALEKADPQNAVVRTTYHKEFLERIKKSPPGVKQ
jgi:hypothetical protein